MERIAFTLFLGVVLIRPVFSQEVIGSSGSTHSQPFGSVEFTIGEAVIETLETSDGTITQGFHQTELTILNVEDLKRNTILLYPNPTRGLVRLQRDNESRIVVQVSDMNGRLVQLEHLTKTSSDINLSGLANGTYLIQVFDDNQVHIKSFKILKNY